MFQKPKTIYYCFPGGKHKALTISYDDGREEDRRQHEIAVQIRAFEKQKAKQIDGKGKNREKQKPAPVFLPGLPEAARGPHEKHCPEEKHREHQQVHDPRRGKERGEAGAHRPRRVRSVVGRRKRMARRFARLFAQGPCGAEGSRRCGEP